jgi:hypothetical protein
MKLKMKFITPLSTCLLILTIISAYVNGQDMIVRDNGDTIKCKVTNMDSNNVYFDIKLHRGKTSTLLSRNQIKDVILPIIIKSPDQKYERKVRTYTAWGIIGGVFFVAGGTLEVIGISKLSHSDVEVVSNGTSGSVQDKSGGSGMDYVVLGIPCIVVGAIVGGISLHKIIKYNRKIKALNNLSLRVNPIYNYKTPTTITLSYRF